MTLSRPCPNPSPHTFMPYSVFSSDSTTLFGVIRPHCSGCPFPDSTTLFGGALSPPLKALGSATQGQARDRDSRAAQDNPQDMRHIRQTYSGRSARVATRPESKAAPPLIFNLPRRLSPPSHASADRRLRPASSHIHTLFSFFF